MKINRKYRITLLFLFGSVASTVAHPFYVSICQLNFNRETSSVEISLKIFADDLGAGLEKAGHRNLYLGESKEDPKTDSYLFEYLKSKLRFKINGQPVSYQFVGKELDDAVVWTYLEIQHVNDLKSVEAECSVLVEVYDTQSNIVQVEKDKEIKNLLLNKQTTTGSIAF